MNIVNAVNAVSVGKSRRAASAVNVVNVVNVVNGGKRARVGPRTAAASSGAAPPPATAITLAAYPGAPETPSGTRHHGWDEAGPSADL